VRRVGDQQRADELLAVADDHRLFDDLARGEGVLLERAGRDVLSRRENDDLFDSVAELEVAVGPQVNNVAGAEPPSSVNAPCVAPGLSQ